MKASNIIFSLIMIGLSIYIFTYSMSLGKDASLFLIIISIPLFVFSIILLFMTVKEKNIVSEKVQVERRKQFKFVFAIITMILYTLVIEYLGFYLTTILLFISTVFILSEEPIKRSVRSYVVLLFTAAVIVGIVYSLFKFMLNVPLPELL
ncbi:tripartite tricarboxylate transporter TctB family protein [Mammaliicoccus sciuri]|uniref:tripartite tricarboxylate transporter TctB family protein n=1 Tax=Sporosarcina sp. FSL K6-3508 TaxID=2921557 RepID=UPI00315A28A2